MGMDGQQELERVEVLVDNLAGSCETALNLCASWSARFAAENRYRTHSRRDGGYGERYEGDDDDDGWDLDKSGSGILKCAASTSLEISGYRIRSTYQIGLTLIGGDFAEGDVECRVTLSRQFDHMLQRVNRLREAVAKRWPLNLNEIYLSSESVRIYSVRALALQYRRLAFGRPVPHEVPIPRVMVPTKRFSWEDDPGDDGDDDADEKRGGEEDVSNQKAREAVGFDSQTAVWSTAGSDPKDEPKAAAFGSEPPSPPLTPKASSSGVAVSAMEQPQAVIPLLRLPGRELGEEEKTIQ